MTNAIYPLWKQALLAGTTPDLSSAGTDVRIILVDTALYTYSAAHDALADIAAGARVAVSGALQNKAVSAAGVFDADDITVSAVSGATIEALVLYYHTGVEATSLLIAYIDTGVTGLPGTPDGTGVPVGFSASGIFAL